MSYYDTLPIETLLGKTLKKVTNHTDEIHFETSDG